MTALINIFPCADDMISEIMLAGHFVKKKNEILGANEAFCDDFKFIRTIFTII